MLLCVNCEQIEKYSTDIDEIYSGEIVDAPFVILQPSVNPYLFSEGTKMELRINLIHSDTIDPPPGYITTTDGLFNNSELVPVPAIIHDKLSSISFSNNIKTFIYFVHPVLDEFNDIDAMVIVSLMRNNETEVRVILTGGEQRRGYGVFVLKRVEENEK